MFVFTKGAARRGRMGFYWWPLILSFVQGGLTTALNDGMACAWLSRHIVQLAHNVV